MKLDDEVIFSDLENKKNDIFYENGYITIKHVDNKNDIYSSLCAHNPFINKTTDVYFDCTEIPIYQCGNGSSSSEKNTPNQAMSNTSRTTIQSSVNNSSVTFNGNKLYEKNNGVVVTNKLNIGILKSSRKLAWKVAKISGGPDNGKNCIVKLCVPEDAKYVRPFDQLMKPNDYKKERCSKAIVEDIQEFRFDSEVSLGPDVKACSSMSGTNASITYQTGLVVYPDRFDVEEVQCSYGIHVFSARNHLINFVGSSSPIQYINIFNEMVDSSPLVGENIKKMLKDMETQTEDVQEDVQEISHKDTSENVLDAMLDDILNDIPDTFDIPEKKRSCY